MQFYIGIGKCFNSWHEPDKTQMTHMDVVTSYDCSSARFLNSE